MHTRCYHSDAFSGRLAQLVERHVHTVEVIGSRPVSPTPNMQVRRACAPLRGRTLVDGNGRSACWTCLLASPCVEHFAIYVSEALSGVPLLVSTALANGVPMYFDADLSGIGGLSSWLGR